MPDNGDKEIASVQGDGGAKYRGRDYSYSPYPHSHLERVTELLGEQKKENEDPELGLDATLEEINKLFDPYQTTVEGEEQVASRNRRLLAIMQVARVLDVANHLRKLVQEENGRDTVTGKDVIEALAEKHRKASGNVDDKPKE